MIKMPENAPNPSIVNQPDFWARYFRQKLEIPTESYRDLTSEEHRWAFAIAGVTNLQLLSDVKKSLTDELEKDEGFTYRDWLTKFDETTKKYGWNPEGWRASLILQQNIRNSFASGRWYQMTDPDLLQQTAAWVWRHRWPENPRLDHLALNGKRYPPGETQFDGQGVPPNSHYHCHCVLTAELIGEAQELGNPILDPVENTERFAPGQSPEERQETLRAIIDRLPDTIPDGDVQLLRLLEEQIEDYVEEAVDEAIEEYVKESPLTDNEDPDSGDED